MFKLPAYKFMNNTKWKALTSSVQLKILYVQSIVKNRRYDYLNLFINTLNIEKAR